MMDFQTMLQGLNVYWKAHGCALLQPYDSEVATGVLYPETFFRLLGPNPWQAAYAATARRPSDGRYGSNPYRLQHYFQYQVLLKPSVQDVQTRYLDSLKALDIDLRAHDLRFVEDTWELVNLGAWGLGWDVWLDGLSISRITYLQQLGGVALEPVTVKLSYGLARLAMHLQAAAHVYDVQYSPEHSLGDLYQVFEAQHSSYNFDHVDSSLQRELFERYEAEAMRLLELELVYPAYDFVIKANHSYNLLAVRDTLPQPERQTYGQRLRRLSEDVAQCYLERVQAPLLIQKEASADSATPAKTAGASSGLSSATSHSTPSHPATSHPATSHPATSPEESA